jgi:hypothetical protein
MQPLLGYLPDVDVATPGALLEVSNVIPDEKGMRGAPTMVAIEGVPVLAAACRGAAVTTKLDGTRRIIAGTSLDMYELSGGSWSDISRVGNYSLGPDDRWDFIQFGDATLCANKETTIQRSTSGAFADVSGAPKAKILEVAAGFVMAFDTDDGTYGDSPDRWWCSALNDDTDWTVSVTTQCNTGRLVSSPGAITAASALGDQVVAYKDRSIYLGRYVGSPDVWAWDQIPADIGCVGVEAVTDIAGLGHFVVGRSDIYIFDGTRPYSVAEGAVRQWFYSNCSQAYLYRTAVVHDKQNSRVWVFYPSLSSTGTLDAAMCFHLGTKRWGKATMTIEAALNYVSAGLTWDTLPGTWDTLPDVAWDSQYWQAGGRLTAVFNSSHQASSLTGVTGASSMTLFDVGDDIAVTRLKRLVVAYQTEPTTGAVSGLKKMARGEQPLDGGTGTYSGGKFDIRQTARFHRLQVAQTGNWSASHVDMMLAEEGRR